ncbi:MAG: KpsF/GutQ family sugar-phosphate isomerase [Alphaproteobacteria bacterium]
MMIQPPNSPTKMESLDLTEALRVLRLEAEALTVLANRLDQKFMDALDVFSAIKGRLIVTGMGKSGLVGKKIAATLSSTGTPSFFVHPGEASHGDLGMLTPQDAVLALSNSGETKELFDLIAYTRRYNIPLVSITQKGESSLAKDSDVALILPTISEACPNGLAPTTSTTMMLALGDAIALCLLKRKGFSKEDYKTIHPGGNLGSRLKRAKDMMHKGSKMPLIDAGKKVDDAILIMSEKSFGCVGVVEHDKLVGIITDGDLRRHMSPHLLKEKVMDVMSPNPRTVGPETLLEEALYKMAGAITALFVVDDHNKPLGILHIHDLLRLGIV